MAASTGPQRTAADSKVSAGDVRRGQLPRRPSEKRREREVARPVRRERHRGKHREDVDHERLRVEEQRQRGPQARHGAHEMSGQEDPLARGAIAGDRHERRDERARHHPGEQHDPDGPGAVRLERDDSQGDERRPLGGVETAPRKLRPPKPRIRPKLTQRAQPLGDTCDRHAASIAGRTSEHRFAASTARKDDRSTRCCHRTSASCDGRANRDGPGSGRGMALDVRYRPKPLAYRRSTQRLCCV